jgi:outer membrane protein OmpA-like peptidoglycan-associated protein
MERGRVKLGTGIVLAALLLAGCETNPETGQRQMSQGGKGALAGAAGAALIGGAFGGKTGALVGAGVGSILGGAVGGYMDRQEREMRAATANTGIEVQRQGEEIALTFPDSITFATNSAMVQPDFRTNLEKVAQVLNQYPSTVIGVYGHTDSTGSTSLNERLSLERAQSVAGTLEQFGVNSARITTRGFGYTQPVASNDTPEGRAQNRRVEIRVIPVTQEDMKAAQQAG